MRARFASIVGATIDPTGSISVQGDFYHQAGGQIAIDLGGYLAGVDYDTINVVGKVDLAGNLSVALTVRRRRRSPIFAVGARPRGHFRRNGDDDAFRMGG